MRRRLGFTSLISILGLLPLTLICVGLSAYLIDGQLKELRGMIVQRAGAVSGQLSALAAHLIEQDRELLAELSRSALEEAGVRAVTIYDAQLEPVSHAGPAIQPPDVSTLSRDQPQQFHIDEDQLQVIHAIVGKRPAAGPGNEEILGWVQMHFSWHQYELRKYQSLLSTAMILGLSALISLAMFSYVNHTLRGDLVNVLQAIRRLANGSRDFHIHIPGNDEFSDIARELNRLSAAQVKELQELQRSLEMSNSDLRETLETVEIQNIELDLARREAVRANRVKSEFLANTSHEIRTPLNSIIGFSNILLKSELQGRQREALETMRNSAESLLTIINDILDFSKLEAGKLVFDRSPINLRELAEDTLIMLAPQAYDKGLELALFIQHDCPDTVLGDALRLRQMMTNLINNAIKFTPSGHIRVDIVCVDCNPESATLTVRVSDTGIGINAAQRDSIFKDFAQADASVTRQYGGTGLGLVIVKGLAKEMGGEVGVDSDFGKGSTFWFTVNLPIDHNAMQIRNFNALRGYSVALYERSTLYAQSLSDVLQSWGMEVRHCRDIRQLDRSCDYSILCLDKQESNRRLPSETPGHPGIVLSPNLGDQPHNDGRIWLSKPVSCVRLYDALCGDIHQQLGGNREAPYFGNNRVLIVDDNPSNLHILSAFLADFGIDAVSACNGVEALSYCQDQLFDLIFIDIQMPQLDGIEASRQIRQSSPNSATPIVAISAYLAPENPQQIQQAGINEYLSKPVGESQLATVLDQYLQRGSPSTGPVAHYLPASEAFADEPRPVDIGECLHLSRQRPELAINMLEMLTEELPATRTALINSYNDRDWQQLAEISHGLKGNCAYTGTPNLRQAVLALENTLKAGDTQALQPRHREVLAAIDELLTWTDEHDLEVLFE